MPLIALWQSIPGTVGEFSIEQVVATAGDGNLKDGSICSQELVSYFAQIPSEKLAEYSDQCLTSKFDKGGVVLQDLVNELGRRLDYKVTNGRYQGTVNAVGYDGIWVSPEGEAIIAEVKTTDAYRISLETLATYRKKLLAVGTLEGLPSILIIVGRQDTGELEAQIRGSRHAWDMRLISVEALSKLVKLKENSEDLETGRKIRSILTPLEYTRLDRLVDVMFTAATEAASVITELHVDNDNLTSPTNSSGGSEIGEAAAATRDTGASGPWEFTDQVSLQLKRNEIISAMSRKFGVALIKKSQALYWSADHLQRMACTISKRYSKRSNLHYWYAFHPKWDEFLSECNDGYFVLGCMDLSEVFAIPIRDIREILPHLNITETVRGMYWHIVVLQNDVGAFEIVLAKKLPRIAISKYKISLLN